MAFSKKPFAADYVVEGVVMSGAPISFKRSYTGPSSAIALPAIAADIVFKLS